MKYFLKILAVISLVSMQRIGAQQVVKKDTLSGTPYTIMMDQKISDLLSNVEDKCATTITTGSNRENNYADNNPRATTPNISVPERTLTNAEICRKNPRIMGYKIQIAVVKSNDEARKIGSSFRQRFPNMKVELDASLRPNYKVLAGSYFTKQSAAADLSRIRKFFDGAIAVQYRVFCVEAK